MLLDAGEEVEGSLVNFGLHLSVFEV